MTDNGKVEGKTWEVLAEKVKDIGYGTWLIELRIHKGKCVGFKQKGTPEIEFREYQG